MKVTGSQRINNTNVKKVEETGITNEGAANRGSGRGLEEHLNPQLAGPPQLHDCTHMCIPHLLHSLVETLGLETEVLHTWEEDMPVSALYPKLIFHAFSPDGGSRSGQETEACRVSLEVGYFLWCPVVLTELQLWRCDGEGQFCRRPVQGGKTLCSLAINQKN